MTSIPKKTTSKDLLDWIKSWRPEQSKGFETMTSECTCGLKAKIEAEIKRLESITVGIHLDLDRFATAQVAGQIQLLKAILGHEYYK